MAIGDIGNSVLESLNVTDIGQYPSIVQLDGNYVAIAGWDRDSPYNCWIKTYSVTNSGATITLVDSWNFTTGTATNSDETSITKIPGTTDKYAIAFKNGFTIGGEIFTTTISTTGEMAKTKIDTFNNSSGNNFYHNPKIFHTGDANNNCFVVDKAGHLDSFSIDSDGNISDVLDELSYNNVNDWPGDIINLDSNYYAYIQGDIIRTFSVAANGDLTSRDSWACSAIEYGLGFIKVGTSTKYLIAYSDYDDYVNVSSINISDTGIIAENLIDTLQFNPYGMGRHEWIAHVSGDYFAVNYVINLSKYVVATFTCTSAGVISDSVHDSLILINDTVRYGQRSGPVRLTGDIYTSAAVVADPYTDGELVTYEISDKPPTNPGGDINWCHTKVRG